MVDTLDFCEKPTILAVDDTSDNLALIAGLLKKNYRVKVANSGERALKIIQGDAPPDLILLDIIMPGMSGHDVCQTLKATPPQCRYDCDARRRALRHRQHRRLLERQP